MSCMCRIGGATCNACRFASAQVRKNQETEARMVRLEQRVLELEEVVKMLRATPTGGADK